MSKRGKVVQGRFGRGRSRGRLKREQGLRQFWPEARPRPIWKRYAPLWIGAVLIGTAYGSGVFEANPLQLVAPLATGGQDASQLAGQRSLENDERTWVSGNAAAIQAPEPLAVDKPEGIADVARLAFGLCHTGGGTNCVVDGDTIWFHRQRIRVADIDAPETHDPQCASEQALGDQATARLHQLVNSGVVTLTTIDRDVDGYGRKLRIVEVDGTSVGETLVDEGLARWYAGGRKSWCS